jgi:hypothetical protein
MIIYQVTNNWCKDETITQNDKFLYFSKYYATKEEALAIPTKGTHIYKITLDSLGREEVADILSMGHVSFEHSSLAGGYHEIHDISKISRLREVVE